jgi:PIN domain nuclease of toxin-antitoxin system
VAGAHAGHVGGSPSHQNDPFDRLIIAHEYPARIVPVVTLGLD